MTWTSGGSRPARDADLRRSARWDDATIDVIDGPAIPGLAFRHFRGDADLPGIVGLIHSPTTDGDDYFPSVDGLLTSWPTR